METDNLNIGSIFVYNDDIAYSISESEHTDSKSESLSYFFRWKDGWSKQELQLEAVSIAVCEKPEIQVFIIGNMGNLFRWGKNGFSPEVIDISEEGPQHYGNIRNTATIDGHVYVVGMGRTVYKNDDVGSWIRHDYDIRDAEGSVGFNAIGGYQEDELYAVGFDGEIFYYNGNKWNQVKSPTKLILNAVVCTPNSKVYACGQNGTLLFGRYDKWEIINQKVVTDTFLSAVWFLDKLYLSTSKGLFQYTEAQGMKEVTKLPENELIPGASFNVLSCSENWLWSAGRKLIMRTKDGKHWEKVSIS
ncbi:hypothetical protein [Aquimarina litoralis]|uniref:hypothetical protein n=1 Tax=Aquimarina litoralis TaxID=584605 RepID=UPI001C57BEBC|nr:hypothetical protein [Aquimarina litoralis]MBW1298468.1 hypothetical protein [Aquimarina litoralis]